MGGAKSSDELMDTTGDEMERICGKSTAGKSLLLRILTDKEHPRTHMPGPTRAQFPGVEIDDALTIHPTMRNCASRLIPSQASVSSPAKLMFGAEAS